MIQLLGTKRNPSSKGHKVIESTITMHFSIYQNQRNILPTLLDYHLNPNAAYDTLCLLTQSDSLINWNHILGSNGGRHSVIEWNWVLGERVQFSHYNILSLSKKITHQNHSSLHIRSTLYWLQDAGSYNREKCAIGNSENNMHSGRWEQKQISSTIKSNNNWWCPIYSPVPHFHLTHARRMAFRTFHSHHAQLFSSILLAEYPSGMHACG